MLKHGSEEREPGNMSSLSFFNGYAVRREPGRKKPNKHIV
jgi:hypothetical protein